MLISIIGKRGTGKTTLAKQIIKAQSWDNLFIYDYLGEYKEFKNEATYSRTNLYQVLKLSWNASSPDKNNLLVLDEVDLYGYGNEQLEFLYRYGRHKNLSIIAISRRFYNLPVYIRALTEVFYLFKITEERDLNYLKSLVSKAFISKIITLEKYHYIKLQL